MKSSLKGQDGSKLFLLKYLSHLKNQKEKRKQLPEALTELKYEEPLFQSKYHTR